MGGGEGGGCGWGGEATQQSLVCYTGYREAAASLYNSWTSRGPASYPFIYHFHTTFIAKTRSLLVLFV